MDDRLIPYVVIAVCWIIGFGGAISYLRALYSERKPLKYNFYITDIWAGIIALLPFYLLISNEFSGRTEFTATELLFPALILFSELAGVYMGRILSVTGAKERIPGQWSQASWIIFGAWGGLLWLLIVFSGFGLMWALNNLLTNFFKPAPGRLRVTDRRSKPARDPRPTPRLPRPPSA